MASRRIILVALSVCLSLFWVLEPACGESAPAAKAAGALTSGLGFQKDILPLLQKYCWDCHGEGARKGDVALDGYKDAAAISAGRKIWASAHFNIDNWLMPPASEEAQPTPAEREKLTKYLDAVLNPYDPERPDPGRVTLRRLNRSEYNNTVRDLLGVDIQPANEFPEDDSGYGFDTIGDVLSIPPILMERYLSAAERVLDAAIPTGLAKPVTRVFNLNDLRGDGDTREDNRVLAQQGVVSVEHEFVEEAEFILRAKVYGEQAGGENVRAQLRMEGTPLLDAEIKAVRGKPQTIEAKFKAKKGKVRLGVAFINDFWDPKAPPGKQDRNLCVMSLEIDGPTDAGTRPDGMAQRIFAPGQKLGESEKAARAILQNFANRAFRRAATTGEVDRLLKLYSFAKSKGEDYRSSLKLAMKAVMVSPYFLYRIEWQPEPNNSEMVVEISEFALASRLSYFLWSSMPDDELLSLAFRNELRKNLPAQLRRMLADGKLRALAANFGGQWLELRSLQAVHPDKKLFPQFNENLRDEMIEESEQFFVQLVKGNASVLDFVTANYSYLNERLARHYGIAGVSGNEVRRVEFPPNSHRRGVLTQAAVLTLTSDPNRTSPVKRGKWILENFLDTSPPPPPPNVPPLGDGKAAGHPGTLRQRMEEHRKNPACASCHRLLDPIGFGFENYDALGQWRDRDDGLPIDGSGTLTTGQSFGNAIEFSEMMIRDKKEQFVRGLIKKMLIYALGRGLEAYDKPAVEGILAKMRKENFSAHSLIFGIVESLPFQKRRGDAAPSNVK